LPELHDDIFAVSSIHRRLGNRGEAPVVSFDEVPVVASLLAQRVKRRRDNRHIHARPMISGPSRTTGYRHMYTPDMSGYDDTTDRISRTARDMERMSGRTRRAIGPAKKS
jgi:hypothetical protein